MAIQEDAGKVPIAAFWTTKPANAYPTALATDVSILNSKAEELLILTISTMSVGSMECCKLSSFKHMYLVLYNL